MHVMTSNGLRPKVTARMLRRASVSAISIVAVVVVAVLLAPLGHSQEPTTAGASSASLAQPTLSRPAIEPGQSATVLTDGRWLLIGGTAHPGELRVFDPARSTTTDLPIQLAEPRSGHTATLMPDGTVLVVGGKTTNGWVTIDAEQFDPNTGSLVSL